MNKESGKKIEILISSMALLQEMPGMRGKIEAIRRAFFWSLPQYLELAQKYGADGIAYEPLRRISAARRQADEGELDGVGVLMQPARGEHSLLNLLDEVFAAQEHARAYPSDTQKNERRLRAAWARVPVVAFYNVLQPHLSESPAILGGIQKQHDQALPVTVYPYSPEEGRIMEGVRGLPTKALIWNDTFLSRFVVSQASDSLDSKISAIQTYLRSNQFTGLSIDLATFARSDVFGRQWSRALQLLAQRNLISEVGVRPVRFDLPGNEYDKESVAGALATLRGVDWTGRVIYSPGEFTKAKEDIEGIRKALTASIPRT